MKTCFLFPGQGAQYVGMGKDLWESAESVRDTFALASEISGFDLPGLLFDGTEEQLRATDVTQVAISVVNISAAKVLNQRGIQCDGCAGFSLGEFSALCVAGILTEADLFKLVKIRGEVMERASRALDSSDGSPGMAAVLGVHREVIEKTLESNGISGVYVANHNSPSQIVLSGTHDGLNAAETAIKEAGAKRYIRLKVSGPFHSPLLESARNEFQLALDRCDFSDPSLPVYSNVSGSRIETGTQAKTYCGQQIVSTVKWVEGEASVIADGYERCLEVGPGKVLTGLWKSASTDISCQTAGTLEQILEIQA